MQKQTLCIISKPTFEDLTDETRRQQPRASATKTAPLRVLATDQPPNRKGSPAIKAETSGKDTPPRPGSSYPALKTSNIDVDAKPFYEPNGKPITEIDMDAGMSNLWEL